MTSRRKFLIQTLGQVQNHQANQGRDILTITGFMSDDQVARHLAACVAQIEKREARS